MSASFEDFVKELEAEAQAEGPEAVAELETFRARFSLARQLAARRREQSLTQKQLADLSGIDQAEISRIERGLANPTASTIAALAHALALEVQLVPLDGPRGQGDARWTQPVTATDIRNGRVRLPITTRVKALFPDRSQRMLVLLRGHELECAYDPRLGPDRERSGVLLVGRKLRGLVTAGERLRVERHSGGTLTLE